MKDRAIELARQVGAVVEVGLAPVFHDERMILVGVFGFSFLFSGASTLVWRALS